MNPNSLAPQRERQRTKASAISSAGILICLLHAGAPVAGATCPTRFDFISVAPSPGAPRSARSFFAWFECYNAFTGEPGNCAFTYRATGTEQPDGDVDNNGGHFAHAASRPLVLADNRNPGSAVIFAADSDPAPISVAGSTLATPPFRGARVMHPTPEVSGRLAIEATLTAPPSQFFCSFTQAGRVQPAHFTVDVRVPGLEPLPAVGTDHEVVRGGTDTHPEGTFATPQTMMTLAKIAKEYRDRADSKLSVNDLSLPAGGLFDLRANWQAPHLSHRDGLDADINRRNIAGALVACRTDRSLMEAMAEVSAGARVPKLVCEPPVNPPPGLTQEELDLLFRRHIDF